MKGLRITGDMTAETKAGYTLMAIVAVALSTVCIAITAAGVRSIMPAAFTILFAAAIVIEISIVIGCACEVIMMRCGLVYYLKVDGASRADELPSAAKIVGKLKSGELCVRVTREPGDGESPWL